MSQSEYFINKLFKQDQKSLYENPGDFLTSHKKQLTQFVRDDMHKLAALVTPVHSTQYCCNPYDSWTNHIYWYHVNQDKKDTATNLFNIYYPMCGLCVPLKWDFKGNTVFELNVPRDTREIKDVIFDCLRTVYFYDNYDDKGKWGMRIPGNQNICFNGQVYNDDFVDCVNFDRNACKMRYSKQNLDDQINGFCTNIANKAADLINSDVWSQERQTDIARKEIAQAYAILKKYHLMGTDVIVQKR